jgi:hypothetical protein
MASKTRVIRNGRAIVPTSVGSAFQIAASVSVETMAAVESVVPAPGTFRVASRESAFASPPAVTLSVVTMGVEVSADIASTMSNALRVSVSASRSVRTRSAARMDVAECAESATASR